jgi:hypothetical protein
MGEARARNYERWPILGRAIWPNKYIGRTYEDEIKYLKDFIRQRLAWIDRQFVAAPLVANGKPGESLTLTAAVGKIYYPRRNRPACLGRRRFVEGRRLRFSDQDSESGAVLRAHVA